MTKKDFELIARLLRSIPSDGYRGWLAGRFADALERHPTRTPFVRERFLAIALGKER